MQTDLVGVIGNEIAHRVDDRHDSAVLGGDPVVYLQAVGMAAHDVVHTAVCQKLGFLGFFLNGILDVFFTPVDVAEDYRKYLKSIAKLYKQKD